MLVGRKMAARAVFLESVGVLPVLIVLFEGVLREETEDCLGVYTRRRIIFFFLSVEILLVEILARRTLFLETAGVSKFDISFKRTMSSSSPSTTKSS